MGIGRRRKRSVTLGIGGRKRMRRSINGGMDYVGGAALQVNSVKLNLNHKLSIHMISTQFDAVQYGTLQYSAVLNTDSLLFHQSLANAERPKDVLDLHLQMMMCSLYSN